MADRDMKIKLTNYPIKRAIFTLISLELAAEESPLLLSDFLLLDFDLVIVLKLQIHYFFNYTKMRYTTRDNRKWTYKFHFVRHA